MICYMLSDKNGNLIFVGTPQIRIPEKMFFLAKNGQVREAPTTTKTGALSMRGGVRSISLIPDGDKVEIVKLGETLEEFRKRQSKKESEDFIKKVNETKINKKLDIGNMPELPEPKKEKEVVKPKIDYKEIAHNDYKNNNRFLSDWLDIERTNKESGILPEEMEFINVMYDLMDKQFKTDEVRKSFKKINFSQKAQEYIQDWIDKKKDGQTELSDFVKLVIFPALKKDNKDIDNLTLLLFGLQIASDFKQKIDLKWGASKSQFNSYRVWKIFNIVKGKITGVFPELKKLNGYTSAYGDWLGYREGNFARRQFK